MQLCRATQVLNNKVKGDQLTAIYCTFTSNAIGKAIMLVVDLKLISGNFLSLKQFCFAICIYQDWLILRSGTIRYL